MQIIIESKNIPEDTELLEFNHYCKWKMADGLSLHTELFIIHTNFGNTA
jgi:hypothetical protein